LQASASTSSITEEKTSKRDMREKNSLEKEQFGKPGKLTLPVEYTSRPLQYNSSIPRVLTCTSEGIAERRGGRLEGAHRHQNDSRQTYSSSKLSTFLSRIIPHLIGQKLMHHFHEALKRKPLSLAIRI
jgi:hypothetical protein